MIILKKLIIYGILLTLIYTGCSNEKHNIIVKDEFKDEHMEIIPENSIPFIEKLDVNDILLTTNEIEKYNKNIMAKSNTMYDLDNIKNVSKSDILSYINYYKIPDLPKYNGNVEVSLNEIEIILENRSIDSIMDKNTIQKGIIVHRTNLKSFPTDIHFFEEKNTYNFDVLQESELYVNTPILILHESKDKKWDFVLSTTYAGWVKTSDIALASEDDYNFFVKNKDFGIITTPSFEIQNTILDMGVKLPFINTSKNGYNLIIPIKNKNGYVGKNEISISKDNVHIGYLPYTKRNLYIQSFKYENINYSWGGMDKGVDCSSYVANVYKTFGFTFPRNTSSQNSSVGKIISLSNKSNIEKINIISNNYPSLLYETGHVMIYLGKLNNKHYIVHASGDKNEMKVIMSELAENSKHISNIDKQVLIK